MRKISLILTSFLLSCSVCHNTQDYKASCLLIPTQEYVMMYKTMNETIPFDSIINDSIKESYVVIGIHKISSNMAFVKTENTLGTIEHKGWVDKRFLGIFLSQPNIFLYDQPKHNSRVCDSIRGVFWGDWVPIIDCKNKWIYTSKNGHEGWIAPQDQCDNPYSSCN